VHWRGVAAGAWVAGAGPCLALLVLREHALNGRELHELLFQLSQARGDDCFIDPGGPAHGVGAPCFTGPRKSVFDLHMLGMAGCSKRTP
jgi:hypothetical protein